MAPASVAASGDPPHLARHPTLQNNSTVAEAFERFGHAQQYSAVQPIHFLPTSKCLELAKVATLLTLVP